MATSRITPADQATGAVRFALPQMAGPIAGQSVKAAEAPPVPVGPELAELRRLAYAEAYAKGYAEGHDEGRARGLQEAQALAVRLAGIMDQLGQPLAEVDAAVIEAVSDLAVLIARHLVRRELKANPGEIVGVVRETMRHLPVAPRAARIRLHPEDADLIHAAFALGEDTRSWRLEADPLMTRGGCIVETDVSRIDASVESRLAAIASRMLGGDRESDREL